MNNSGMLLSLQNLVRTVNGSHEEKRIIDNLSFEFDRGQIYTIMGPSGAGKSSLLRLINRLDEPSSGEIIFDHKHQNEYEPTELRRRIGFLFQVPHLFPTTVYDNILFAGNTISEDEASVLLDWVHLDSSKLHEPVINFSVGEQQRVAIARLLAHKPEIILLDEPTAALDPARTGAIEQLIVELSKELNLTVLMVTHSPNQAKRMNGNSIIMVDGRIVESGNSNELIANPQSEGGRKFIAGEMQ